MPKRPESTETLILALELLRRIPRNRKVTASELHAQLQGQGIERDLRTIQRQLGLLIEHFEIERDDRAKPHGYRWKDNAPVLAVASLTPQESLLLNLAQEHLRHMLPPKLLQTMNGFFEQAQRNLGPENGSNTALERQWPAKVRVVATSQPLLPPQIKPGVFDTVSEALYANRWLVLDYTNAAGERKQSEVMPLGMAQQGYRLYLVCRYKGYDNERSLAMHRIQSAEATHTFTRPKDFDLKKYDDDGRFGYGDGTRVKLSFCINKDAGLHLLESPLSADQQVKELNNAYEITATVVDTDMLEWWLRGFGDAVQNVRHHPIGGRA